MGGPVRCCSTTGLQWDLQNQRLEMGHLVSSSNHIVGGGADSTDTGDGTSKRSTNDSDSSRKAPCVLVQTSDPVLWMTTLTLPTSP